MGKIINLTDDIRRQLIEEFTQKLSTMKIADGKLTYSKKIDEKQVTERMKVVFTPTAYTKMMMLVMSYTSEVGWHGLVQRVNEHEFLITDIVVYPQYVTGATVNTDQAEYEKWGLTFSGEQYNQLRFHGHSHVNFAPTPSATDMQHREGIVSDLLADGFYIFMIVNKKRNFTVAIYDMPSNTLYETADVDVVLQGDDIEAFMKDSEQKVKSKFASTSYQSFMQDAGKSTASAAKSGKTEKKTTKKTAKSTVVKQTALDDSDDDAFDDYLRDMQRQRSSYRDIYSAW